MPFFVVVLDAGEANLLFNGEIVDVVDEPVNPSASSALSVNVSVSEREICRLVLLLQAQPSPMILSEKYYGTIWLSGCHPCTMPLIKSGGVSGLSSVISFTPRLGDVDGTKGGEENSGCERDGEPDRLDFRDADEERLLLSSKDLLVKVAVDVSDDVVATDSANAALSLPARAFEPVGAASATCPSSERGAKFSRMLLPRAPLMPGEIPVRAVIVCRPLLPSDCSNLDSCYCWQKRCHC